LVFPLPSFYLLAGFKGPTSKGRGGRRGEGVGRRGEDRGGERRGRSTCLSPRFDNPGYGPGAVIYISYSVMEG